MITQSLLILICIQNILVDEKNNFQILSISPYLPTQNPATMHSNIQNVNVNSMSLLTTVK